MLSERIKSLRKEKKLSLEQLADMIGTSRQTVHRYETGVIANIPHEKIEALAKALGTSPSSLMGWDDEEIPTFSNITVANISTASTKKIPMLGNVA